MNEKKNTGFAALILSLVVVVVAVLAVKFAGGTAAANAVKPGPEVTPGESQDATPAGKYGAGTYTATAQGMGKVTVSVTVDENNILSIELVDISGETAGLGDKGAQKVANSIMTAQSTDVDVASGATMSSKAVINAVADCLAQAEAAAGSAGEGEAAGIYNAGTYTATAQGMGKVTVSVTVDANSIVSIELVDISGETAGLGDKGAQKVANSIMTAQSTDVDVASGATMSSKAVINAVADCLAQAAN